MQFDKVRSYESRVDPESDMTGILIKKRGFGHRNTHRGRTPCEEGEIYKRTNAKNGQQTTQS